VTLAIQWLISAVAIAVAAWIVPGIAVRGEEWVALAVSAIVLGLVNALVRPVLLLLTLPITLLTLGLFFFVINALTLMLASWLTTNLFGVGLVIDGFWSALVGALLISAVGAVLSGLLAQG
jgi:putative membrane protein